MMIRSILIALLITAVVQVSLATAADPDFEPAATEELYSDMDGEAESEVEAPSPRQFKMAEIADAVLGTELSENPVGIESLIPKSLQYSVAPSCAEAGTCEATADVKQENLADEQNSTEAAKTYKVSCDRRSVTGLENLTVQVLNASQDLMDFLNLNGSECSLVLFYTSWCQFSAQVAPHFNALPRVFPIMHFLALDASQHSSLSTRFGTVAVPNILLFQGAKPMARFNHTERTLDTLTAFITNQTGFEVTGDQTVTEEDQMGPLPNVPVRSIDWLFVFSVVFLTGFSLYAVLKTDSIRLLIPGQEHEHQD